MRIFTFVLCLAVCLLVSISFALTVEVTPLTNGINNVGRGVPSVATALVSIVTLIWTIYQEIRHWFNNRK